MSDDKPLIVTFVGWHPDEIDDSLAHALAVELSIDDEFDGGSTDVVVQRRASGQPARVAESVEQAAADYAQIAGLAAQEIAERSTAILWGKDQAATSLGISVDLFESAVMPHLRVVQIGRRVMVRPDDLREWAQSKAARALRET